MKSKPSIFYYSMIFFLGALPLVFFWMDLLRDWSLHSVEAYVNILILAVCLGGASVLFIFRKEFEIRSECLILRNPIQSRQTVLKWKELKSWKSTDVKNNPRASLADHQALRLIFEKRKVDLSSIEFSNYSEIVDHLREFFPDKEAV